MIFMTRILAAAFLLFANTGAAYGSSTFQFQCRNLNSPSRADVISGEISRKDGDVSGNIHYLFFLKDNVPVSGKIELQARLTPGADGNVFDLDGEAADQTLMEDSAGDVDQIAADYKAGRAQPVVEHLQLFFPNSKFSDVKDESFHKRSAFKVNFVSKERGEFSPILTIWSCQRSSK
jgi:hypothetical protein